MNDVERPIELSAITPDFRDRIRAQIWHTPDFETVQEEMRKIHAGRIKGKMPAINHYYFYAERTKAKVYNCNGAFYDAMTSDAAFDFVYCQAVRYLWDGARGIWKYNNGGGRYIYLAMISTAQLFRSYHLPSTFNLAVAKRIISKYAINDIVFDFACGWGNRLVACLSEGKSYWGVDTNPALVDKLQQCARDYIAATGVKASCDIRCKPSEERIAEYHGRVGLCFSSPPYFDCELYNGEKTSTTLHPTYQGWLSAYLRPTVENCLDYLIEGGHLAINVKNIKTPPRNIYDDCMTICTGYGLELIAEEPYRVNKRTGCAAQRDKPQSSWDERIMVFRKNKPPYPAEKIDRGIVGGGEVPRSYPITA